MSRARNFHLPLPEDLYLQLREEAGKAGRPATALAREALEEWLQDRKKQAEYEEISAYAKEVAGTQDDLDEELEAASLEHLAPRSSGVKGTPSR